MFFFQRKEMPLGLVISFVLTSLLLFLYSYTQIDLNLTLSQVSIWQSIQKSFQYLGYFKRPLSTLLYLVILIFLFGNYLYALVCAWKGKLNEKAFWKLIIGVTMILLFSYPAFSYDIFNYMFTAKTVLVYHKNPYLVSPLQFVGIESWLTFMRWTHLPSAYTPLWIILTLPVYILGFNIFLLTLWNLKFLVALFYLLAVSMIGKIYELQENHKQKIFGMALFALNPLVIIESLVSAHNDIVMMALGLSAVYVLLKNKKLSSFFVLSISIALKLMMMFLLPLWIFNWNRKAAVVLMSLGLILVTTQREILPWYFLWIMPFIALIPDWKPVTVGALGVSMGLLLRYAPYLYFGHWNDPVPKIKFMLTMSAVISSFVIALVLHYYSILRKKLIRIRAI